MHLVSMFTLISKTHEIIYIVFKQLMLSFL